MDRIEKRRGRETSPATDVGTMPPKISTYFQMPLQLNPERLHEDKKNTSVIRGYKPLLQG